MTSVATPIPTNLITGVLGAGKTTAIQSLISQKPEKQKWAIIINEYGQVAIDNALLEQTHEVEVMELASGCVCCTMSFAFEPLLTRLIHRLRPDRLIIEPSGAGHPTRIIDMLRSDSFNGLLDLRATLCLVDPTDFDNPRIAQSTLFNDQLHMSDCVVINWTDKRSSQAVRSCREKIAALDPPKSKVFETAMGQLDLAWLDTRPDDNVLPRYDPAHSASDHGNSTAPSPPATSLPAMTGVSLQAASTALPKRFENQGNGQWACGWIFSAHEIFDRDQIVELIECISPIRRAKGVFHCQDDWWAINRKDRDSSLQPSSYRSDSRVEIIADQPFDWHDFEAKLLKTRVRLNV